MNISVKFGASNGTDVKKLFSGPIKSNNRLLHIITIITSSHQHHIVLTIFLDLLDSKIK